MRLAQLTCRPLQTIARRLPPNPHPGPFVALHMFKDATYCVYCLALFVGFLGLYTVRNDPVYDVCRTRNTDACSSA